MKKAIFIFLFIILMSFGISIKKPNKKVTVVNTKRIKIDTVESANQDIVGHIKIPNTKIDYNIVKTTDNKYYLNHNIKKEIDPLGAVFIDYRNKLSDRKILIYGHNSKTKIAPLKELENYLDYTYFKNNNLIYLKLENNNYIYKIFSVILIDKDNYTYTKLNYTTDEYINHLNWLQNASIHKSNVALEPNSHIIIIQTCNYYPKESFLLISAKRS